MLFVFLFSVWIESPTLVKNFSCLNFSVEWCHFKDFNYIYKTTSGAHEKLYVCVNACAEGIFKIYEGRVQFDSPQPPPSGPAQTVLSVLYQRCCGTADMAECKLLTWLSPMLSDQGRCNAPILQAASKYAQSLCRRVSLPVFTLNVNCVSPQWIHTCDDNKTVTYNPCTLEVQYTEAEMGLKSMHLVKLAGFCDGK